MTGTPHAPIDARTGSPGLASAPGRCYAGGAVAHSPSQLLEAVLEPVAATMGFEIVTIEWAGTASQRVVRVYLDRPEGVSLDDCARLSRVLENALDAAEADPELPECGALLAAAYVLEVSSPGLERPLARRSHFARFAGHRVVVRTTVPIVSESTQRTFHGRIEAVEPDPERPDDDRAGIVIVRALEGDPAYRICLSQVRRANLVYEG